MIPIPKGATIYGPGQRLPDCTVPGKHHVDYEVMGERPEEPWYYGRCRDCGLLRRMPKMAESVFTGQNGQKHRSNAAAASSARAASHAASVASRKRSR